MRSNWQLFSGVVCDADCDKIIEICSSIEPEQATTFSGDKNVHRRSTVRWVLDRGVEDLILRFVNVANAGAFSVETFQHTSEMQFTEYRSDESGFYDWHHDVDWENEKNSDRKISFVLQLSDPSSYEGGDFCFKEVQSPDQNDLRKRGSILIFPSYLIHMVSPVTSGMRRSLVSWVSGPRWR